MPPIFTPGQMQLRSELYHQLGVTIAAGLTVPKALEHLKTDHVALGGADLGGHRAEHPGVVGQPDAHARQHGQWVLVMRTFTRMVCSALPA